MAEISAKDRKEISKLAADRRALAQREKSSPRARWCVEQWTLQLLQERSVGAEELATVVNVARERCRVRRDGVDIECLLGREVGERQQTAIAPGDEVVIEEYGQGHRIKNVRPRRTVLIRSGESES